MFIAQLPGRYECNDAGIIKFYNHAGDTQKPMMKYDNGDLGSDSYGNNNDFFYFYFGL